MEDGTTDGRATRDPDIAARGQAPRVQAPRARARAAAGRPLEDEVQEAVCITPESWHMTSMSFGLASAPRFGVTVPRTSSLRLQCWARWRAGVQQGASVGDGVAGAVEPAWAAGAGQCRVLGV